MSALMDMILDPPLVPMASNISREAHEFNCTATVFDEQSDGFVVYENLRDLSGRRYPIQNTRNIDDFATERDYTDAFLLDSYQPRLHSGLLLTVTDKSGEQMDYDIKGVAHNGDSGELHGRTLLLMQRRLDRA